MLVTKKKKPKGPKLPQNANFKDKVVELENLATQTQHKSSFKYQKCNLNLWAIYFK